MSGASEHDPLCQMASPIPGVNAWCTCVPLRMARADERARVLAEYGLEEQS